jgi:hypothetical protein
MSALTTRFKSKKFIWQALIVAVVLLWSFLRAHKGGDFDVFLQAADKLWLGNDPYQPPFIKDDLQYYYSPFFAWLLMPFTMLSWWIPEFAWLVFSAWCYYRCWVLVQQYLSPKLLSQKQHVFWVIATLLILFRYINDNFHMIQMTFFLLWVCMESTELVWKKRPIAGGALLGLGIAIKTMPLPFVAYWLYRKQFKATAVAVVAMFVYLLVPGLLLGFDRNMDLLQAWWEVINPSNAEHSIEAGPGLHSLTAFVPVYFTETVGQIPVQRNFFDFSAPQAMMITNVARFLLVVTTLFFVGLVPFENRVSPRRRLYETAYICLSIPLLFPHQQKYAFLFVMPAVAWLIYWFLARKQAEISIKGMQWASLIWFVAALMVLTLTVRGVLGRYGYDWAQHFRIMTVGVLMLIPALYVCKPEGLPKGVKV